MSTTESTSVRHLSISSTTTIQSTESQPITLDPFRPLFLHLISFFQVSPLKLYVFLFSSFVLHALPISPPPLSCLKKASTYNRPRRTRVVYSSTLSLTSALDVGALMPRPGRFIPRNESRYPLYRRLGGPQGRSGRVQNISPRTGIRSPDRPARSESLNRISYTRSPFI